MDRALIIRKLFAIFFAKTSVRILFLGYEVRVLATTKYVLEKTYVKPEKI